MRRFDEVDLVPDAYGSLSAPQPVPAAIPVEHTSSPWKPASRFMRLMTFFTDVSLFVALALVLSTLLATRGELGETVAREWPALLALSGFLLLVSYFYFVGCWLLWGKTVGGAIFDVRVVGADGGGVDVSHASTRWVYTIVSLGFAGLGFLIALSPGAKSLPDRISGTRCAYER